ncbi:MAG TPA: hypothetical protein VG603_03955, partial [Chitinophagales bacterium]|nr:hypothetical protein [Chitinophagales bacterium]
MGKIKYTIIIFFVLACSVTAFAQSDIDNGSFEAWKGGEFVKCCGRALAIPLAWSIIEQPMQMATNHFVMRDPTFVNVHSGNFSAELYTDTTTIDSAGDLTGLTAVEVPG